jgi:hypothetical protein
VDPWVGESMEEQMCGSVGGRINVRADVWIRGWTNQWKSRYVDP